MTRPIQHRAFTLIEVLAATVLLAMLSGVCASLLRHAGESAVANGERALFEMLELERLADAILTDRTDLVPCDASDSLDISLPWPDAPDRPPVRIRSVACDSAAGKSAHAWLAFSCEGCMVWRYVSLRLEETPS